MAPFRTLCGAAASVAIVTMASAAVISAANQVQALAQQYPDKPVTIISNSAAGSTPDAVLRVIADRLGQIWGQQVMAVNHPGATGSIASRIAAEAPRDGYTLYMPVLSTFVALPGLAPNVPVQLPRDFTAIGFAAENPMFIVAAPSLGIAKLSDVIARAKARPGEMSCAVTGVGRLTHLTAELLQSRADIKLLTVPYTGGPAHAISDVVSGRVGLLIEGYSGIAGCGSIRLRQGDRGCIGGTSDRVPQCAHGSGNVPRLCGDRLASPGGADRHSRKNNRQSERRSAQGRHESRSQEDDRHARQLYASDVTG